MFTGIVQGLCPVAVTEDLANLRRLTLELGALAQGLELGASVAVNGTCLTVTAVEDTAVTFDVIRETLETTNLGTLASGVRANVERSFRVGDEVGGHILSGHVSGQARVVAVEEDENRRDVTLEVPARWMKYLHHKGYVALDGASLTIAAVDGAHCAITVCLIPETIARTTLGSCRIGDSVNLEVDSQTQAVVDTVERLLADPEWQQRLRQGASQR